MSEKLFWGAGDLLAALLLAHIQLKPGDLASAVEHALASTQGVLLATVQAAGSAAQAKERTPEVRSSSLTYVVLSAGWPAATEWLCLAQHSCEGLMLGLQLTSREQR